MAQAKKSTKKKKKTTQTKNARAARTKRAKNDMKLLAIGIAVVINLLAFTSGNALYITGIILADGIVGYLLYKKYFADKRG